jgi:hypothetical protein
MVEGVNLFTAHCMHLWNYQMNPLVLLMSLIKKFQSHKMCRKQRRDTFYLLVNSFVIYEVYSIFFL